MWDDEDQNGGKQEFASRVCRIAVDVAMNQMVWYTYLEKMPLEFQVILESNQKNGWSQMLEKHMMDDMFSNLLLKKELVFTFRKTKVVEFIP
jgi:hypothetical protein